MLDNQSTINEETKTDQQQDTKTFTYDNNKFGDLPKEVLEQAINFGKLSVKNTWKQENFNKVKEDYSKDLEKNYIPLDKHQESLLELDNRNKELESLKSNIKNFELKESFYEANGNKEQFNNFVKLIDNTKDIKTNLMNLKKEMPSLFNLKLDTNEILNKTKLFNVADQVQKTEKEKAIAIAKNYLKNKQ